MKITKMNDRKALDKFMELLTTRISITTGFGSENNDGVLTHQFLRVKCGELETVSAPEPLSVPLRVATEDLVIN